MTYKEVVEKAKKSDAVRVGMKNQHVTFVECKTWLDGDQINLWTYWQGYQIKDPENGVDILLVGQDWGSPGRNEELLDRISAIQRGEDANYFAGQSPTDRNMQKLFLEAFGCDISKKDPGKRLFFTNYSLGYRDGSETGGMTKKILLEDKEFFDDLVEAISPKMIICLGRITYEAVTGTNAENSTNVLKEGNPIKADVHGIPAYGVPHCGSLGARNVGGFDNMVRVWKNIK